MMRTLVFILAIAALAGCESAEKYKRSAGADSTGAARVGTLAIKGSPEQMVVVRSLTHRLEAAQALWDSGEKPGAIATADSLCRIAEAALDTIPLDQPVADFLLIYTTDSYDRLTVWHKDQKDEAAVAALKFRFDSLAARLHTRRAAAKTP